MTLFVPFGVLLNICHLQFNKSTGLYDGEPSFSDVINFFRPSLYAIAMQRN